MQIFSFAFSSIKLVAQLVAYTGLIADLFMSLLSIWLCDRKQPNSSRIKGKKISASFHVSEIRSMSCITFLSYM